MKTLIMAAAIGLLVVPPIARAEDMKMDTNKSEPKSPVDSAFSKAFIESMTKMMSNMDIKSTGKPDDDFVLMMMPHHQGAIDMAKVELQYGKDPTLRRMAEGIVAAQEKEIAEMKYWQAKNGQ